jgi:hypothetical protein
MELIDDEAQIEARFGPIGDSANLDARLVNGLRRTYHKLGNYFTRTRWKVLGDVGHVESNFGPIGDIVSVGVR